MKDESNREGWEMGRCQLLERSRVRSGGKGRMRRGGGNFWEEWGLEQGECRVKG